MTWSKSPDGGATWPLVLQPDSVPRTETGSTARTAWGAAGWYEDAIAAYPGGTPEVCKSSPNYGGSPSLEGNRAVWPVSVAADCAARQRADLEERIRSQVPNPGTADTIRDNTASDEVKRYLAGESAKLIELQDVADEDLGTFNPTVDPPAADDATAAYSRISVSIVELTPWAGAPQNDLGFKARLQTEEGEEANGADARLVVVDAPSDVSAVLPFTQDANDPAIWWCEARDGHKWADPQTQATVALIWGSGALTVSPNLVVAGKGAKASAAVNYGPAT